MDAPPDIIRPKSSREDALAVVRRLRGSGHVAYFAGGCVRDLLLQHPPKDFDVATDAPPKRVRELFSNTQAIGAAFGVILVRHRASQVEVATFRADGQYPDGRHPEQVRFTTAQEDARRRDFTINGLFLDPLSDQVIDYVGGREDLKAGVIRAIGNPAQRFEEDSLRLLRAVRFAARLGFTIEPATATAIIAHAPQLKRVSPERIGEELRIMLRPPTRDRAWTALWQLELIHTVFRFFKIMRAQSLPTGVSFFERVDPDEEIPFGLALAAAAISYRLSSDAAPQDVRYLFTKSQVHAAVQAMRQALKISNEESELMRGTLAGLEPLLDQVVPGVAVLKRFLAQSTSASSRRLLTALAAHGIENERIASLAAELAEIEKTDYAPPPLIDGNLLTELGLQPGPLFKRILTEVYDAQLEGRVTDRDGAVALAMQIARR